MTACVIYIGHTRSFLYILISVWNHLSRHTRRLTSVRS